MHNLRSVALAVTAAAAIALTPMAAASATAPQHPTPSKPAATSKVHAAIAASSLSIVGHKWTYDVGSAAATVKVRIQVRDHSKKFDPATVTLQITDKATGLPTTTFTVAAKLLGKSKVVTNWRAVITIPEAAVAAGSTATYCITLVTVGANSTTVAPTTTKAKGLAGRDCFKVINSAS
jgi:hypothetical protein